MNLGAVVAKRIVAGGLAGAVSLLIGGMSGLAGTVASAAVRPAEAVSTATPQSPVLSGVWCASRVKCLAVGTDTADQPISAKWNGSAWSFIKTPAKGHQLTALACTSFSDCLAVGLSGLSDHWNGTSWKAVATPVSADLLSVACATAKLCFATGDPQYARGFNGIIVWRGHSWTKIAAPKPAGALGAELVSISCAGRDSCLAVGNYHSKTHIRAAMVLAWNGTQWRLVAKSPVDLDSVSCPGSARCVGVSNERSAVWNGRTWSLVKVPLLNQPVVSCPSTSFCMAASTDIAADGDGTSWTQVFYPQGVHGAIWCVSRTACMAVGGIPGGGTPTSGLPGGATASWNGQTWTFHQVSPTDG
jgi:hypothetical protein